MPVNEEGPGIGVWISLGIGAAAGVLVGWPVAGWIGLVVGFVVVSAVSAAFLA